MAVTGLLVAALALATIAAQPAVPDRAALCTAVERPPAEAVATLAALGDAGRTELLRLAGSPQVSDAACGVAGLAALLDRRVVAPIRAALIAPAFRDQAFRFARWGAYAAGAPESDLGPAFLPLVETLADPVAWAAAGDDGIRLLGAIDQPAARDRLVAEFARPQLDPALDALIHALGRQGESRVRARVVALGQEAVATRSGNLTYEQASRIGAVTFYLLAAAPDTMGDGLQLLRQLTPPDQADAGAWAVQAWCERAMRRPTERAAAERTRAALVAELDGMNIGWRPLERGSFRCGTPVA